MISAECNANAHHHSLYTTYAHMLTRSFASMVPMFFLTQLCIH